MNEQTSGAIIVNLCPDFLFPEKIAGPKKTEDKSSVFLYTKK